MAAKSINLEKKVFLWIFPLYSLRFRKLRYTNFIIVHWSAYKRTQILRLVTFTHQSEDENITVGRERFIYGQKVALQDFWKVQYANFLKSSPELLHGPILTKLSTKHPWVKGINFFSNEGQLPFVRGDYSKLATFKSFYSRTTGLISI